ncbi:gamma-glutamylputrescine oxidase [Steroidobacter denitrificans]|uniref:Gamma-glutamylputrescine oxidase n=1 Tax=Steroidobacter denitrificans TaxID=465721 RepID=A0A127F8W0_STEDE|nr:FAD-binding oxidoreductase [Steroidobacter denitrificans]AMN46071.1 gamma-glutamylputrescine oxidase [Steroidobacter denitrificans]
MSDDHVSSYYAATANPGPAHPPLGDDIEVDVCVVGGGISGCSTALHLAERGYRVALLEGHRIGWGASGRSGGQAIAGYACGQQVLEQQMDEQDARRLWDMSLEALDLLREQVRRHAIDCDLQWGHLHVAVKPRQRDELQQDMRTLQDRYGYSQLEFLERSGVEALLATQRYCAGVLDRGSGHLHPLNYTLGLAAAAQAAGARLHEHTQVVSLDLADPATLVTTGGRVRARQVALCCNAYLDGLVPALRARIMPVATYIIATQTLGEERMRQLLRENIAVADINFVLDYFRRSQDDRLLFGGRVSYSGHDPFDTARATRKRMLQVFPQLADLRIEHAWGGFVDITLNRAPDFGRLAPHIYYLQGFSGHGIALTGLAGRLIAEAIAGQAERFDVFSRLRHRRFPGGRLLRTPALMLAMLWYRLRDLL